MQKCNFSHNTSDNMKQSKETLWQGSQLHGLGSYGQRKAVMGKKVKPNLNIFRLNQIRYSEQAANSKYFE